VIPTLDYLAKEYIWPQHVKDSEVAVFLPLFSCFIFLFIISIWTLAREIIYHNFIDKQ